MPGTTNVLQWNPNANNQETDAQYSADSQRLSGASSPSVFGSELGNKVFYQLTTYVLGLFQALANKGYNTVDSNLPGIINACSNLLTNADLRTPMLYLASSASMVLRGDQADGWDINLVSNVTFTLNNPVVGQIYILSFIQGAAGYTVTWPSNIKGHGTVSPGAGSRYAQAFFCASDNALHPISGMTVS